jgi:carbon monoxide dehydrogenase subunit G
MSSYSATIETTAPPEHVLAVLTDPDAIRDWSPVPFELEGETGALTAGSETHVSGNLAGVRVGFDVQVHVADAGGLRLSAEGPVALDVDYDLRPLADGSEVRASVTVERPGGLRARLIGKATEALLAGGALAGATGRIARAAEGQGPIAVAA